MSVQLPAGMTYRVYHRRSKDGEQLLPRGGETVVEVGRMVQGPDNVPVFEAVIQGTARCNTKLDNYSKKRGRDIALGRALKALKEAEAGPLRAV